MYQHSSSSASNPDALEQGPFPKFAGDELDDFLFAKALEFFAHGLSLCDVQEQVSDWHILKAAIGAVLSDDDVEAIVARAEKVAREIPPIAHEGNVVYLERVISRNPESRTITIDRPGYTGTPLEVKITRE